MTIDLTLSDDEQHDAVQCARARAPGRAAAAGLARTAQLDPDREDDDADDVLLCAGPPEALAPSEAAVNVDDDIAIVRNNTRNPNRDWPHSRKDCATFKFVEGASRSNAKFCAQCYCTLCNCKASECASWGDGTSVGHHCNNGKPVSKSGDKAARGNRATMAAFPPGPRPPLFLGRRATEPSGPLRASNNGRPGAAPHHFAAGLHGRAGGPSARLGDRPPILSHYAFPFHPPFDEDMEESDFGGLSSPHLTDDEDDGLGFCGFDLEDPWELRSMLEGRPRARIRLDESGRDAAAFNLPKDAFPRPVNVKQPLELQKVQPPQGLLFLASLELHAELDGMSFADAAARLQEAPWGYVLSNRGRTPENWQKWKDAFGSKLGLQCLLLNSPADGLAPPLQVWLERRQPRPAAPAPYSLRAVLFVDCTRSTAPRMMGVRLPQGQDTVGHLKAKLKEQLSDRGEGLYGDEHLMTAIYQSYFGEGWQLLSDSSHFAGNGRWRAGMTTVPSLEVESSVICCVRVKKAADVPNAVRQHPRKDLQYVLVEAWYAASGVGAAATGAAASGDQQLKLLPLPIILPAVSAQRRFGSDFSVGEAEALVREVRLLMLSWRKSGSKASSSSMDRRLAQRLYLGCLRPMVSASMVVGQATVKPKAATPRPVFTRLPPYTSALKPQQGSGYSPSSGLTEMLQHVPNDKDLPTIAREMETVMLSTALVLDPFDKGRTGGDGVSVRWGAAAWAKPPLHAPLTQKALETHDKYLADCKRYDSHVAECKSKVDELVSGLVHAGPATFKTNQNQKTHNAHVYTKVSLVRKADGSLRLRCDAHTNPPRGSGAAGPQVLSSVLTDPGTYTSATLFKYLRPFLDAVVRESVQLKSMQTWVRREGQEDFFPSWKWQDVVQELEASADLPAAAQPPGFSLGIQMHGYQLQSLEWMLQREREELRDVLWVKLDTPDNLYYSPALQMVSKDVPSGVRGGFLAEEMGLGKTVEVLALVLANPPPRLWLDTPPPAGQLPRSRATLVICKVSLVGQWMAEARSKLMDRGLVVVEYHGPKRVRDVSVLSDSDVVVTTYDTLVSDFIGRSRSAAALSDEGQNPVAHIKWWRLVMDESHAVKDPGSKMAQAVKAIQADRRWACSGTLVNADPKDLLGQFNALQMVPLDQKAFQRHVLTQYSHTFRSARSEPNCSPWEDNERRNYCSMMTVLSALVMRHTKAAVQAHLRLPSKHEQDVPIKFSTGEWDAYTRAHAVVRAAFDRYEAMGACVRYKLTIMSLLMRLRRLCSGGRFQERELTTEPALPGIGGALARQAAAEQAGPAGAGGAGVEWIGKDWNKSELCLPPADDAECPICAEPYDDPLRTACGHWFCEECLLATLGQRTTCPMCRAHVAPGSLRPANDPGPLGAPDPAGARDDDAADGDDDADAARAATGWVLMSSKIDALVAQLREMRAADASNKALIFTQFAAGLPYLEEQLTAANFKTRTIRGGMPMKQRSAAIDAFQNDPRTTVFLLSVRAGAVGINLTAANHIFVMEPLLSSALDEQAIGRAWRMGQTRPVFVKRLFVKGTVEENILEVVRERKENPVQAAEGNEDDDGPLPLAKAAKKLKSGCAGALKQDREDLKLRELTKLFAHPVVPE